MIFHLLCPGFGDRWRLGLRFWCCAHTGGVQDKRAVAVQDRGIVGSCSVLGISWISPAPMAIFNKQCEILDWIYKIYADFLIAE